MIKKKYLFLLGFIPFGLGFIMSKIITAFPNIILPYRLIGIAFILFWGYIGFKTYDHKKSTLFCLCTVNSIAFIVLLLNLYQEIILGQYWGNILSAFTQHYYLPILNISFSLSRWSDRLGWAYAIGFLIMCLSYYIGLQIQKKRSAR